MVPRNLQADALFVAGLRWKKSTSEALLPFTEAASTHPKTFPFLQMLADLLSVAGKLARSRKQGNTDSGQGLLTDENSKKERPIPYSELAQPDDNLTRSVVCTHNRT